MPESEIHKLKNGQLQALAAYRDHLRMEPELRWLFFEVTNTCNLFCAHCGSSCTAAGNRLSADDVQKTLRTIPENLKPMICLTGGEPLTHPEFFEIAGCVSGMGFHWGMTSNGTLIDRLTARKLRETGMGTVSISLDGMEKTHDKLRQKEGAWKKAIDGIRYLQDAGFSPQITTVVHADNIDELEELYLFLCGLGITSWRPINVEPIGRACESERMLLTASQFDGLLNFIREKRYDQSCPMEVTYGCSHFLGTEMERMVRKNYFFCGAGIWVASVRSNGDICACLDIENLPSLVQGNIGKDSFWDIWRQRFEAFRSDRTEISQNCQTCEDRYICGGDSAHTWDWTKNEPLLCLKTMQSSQ